MRLDTASLIFLGLIAIACAAVMMPARSSIRVKAKVAKATSIMKQIGTGVNMYFHDKITSNYPKQPKNLDLDKFFIRTNKTASWTEINYYSPYFFFCDENSVFKGSANVPLATNWEPAKHKGKEFLFVVWEDGHVSTVSQEEQKKMIHSSSNGFIIKLARNLTFQTNSVLP